MKNNQFLTPRTFARLTKFSANLEYGARITVVTMAIGMMCYILLGKEMRAMDNQSEMIDAQFMQSE